jgi:hypothetical protein
MNGRAARDTGDHFGMFLHLDEKIDQWLSIAREAESGTYMNFFRSCLLRSASFVVGYK